ncbi:adenine-specific DNA-methyltransferase [Tenacibaculum skagerrakense]|uniref:site-specific DNA-methyltransferase (adenine-specific) n=1 Tax=Tenacibaculum skagerrakense TaxID=186571 RepID=A0A4R2NLB0_9FLAO|nr:site-specific DNA-methyltransferase [Tenacibaculum skagerrakense]TCP22399.1 adenine-specific DNA-methyltransferase [Tenacibaculum skagerrakense]
MDGTSLTPEQEKLNTLKQVLPEVFTEGKVDWEKLKATLGEDINFSNERYVLNWAGKSEAFKVLQAPTTKTLVPAKDESVNFDDTEHIFIEGENLEVLKVLQKSYFGKVKMIYIDPPYNTGNDSFIYPDKFSETKEEYEKRVGDKDEEGYMTKDGMFKKNSKENGQYHSNWLNMMMPRLYLAKNLLKQDGVIFISIDDNEVHNLRLLMNEIFGEENFVGNVVWKHTEQSKNDERFFSRQFNYQLVYIKSDDTPNFRFPRTGEDNKNYSNPDNDPNGDWRSGDVRSPNFRKTLCFDIKTPNGNVIPPPEKGWRWKEETINEKIESGEIVFNSDETKIIRKIYLANQEGRVPENLWQGELYGTTRMANAEIKQLFEELTIFDTPKPSQLVKRVMQLFHNEKDFLVLDFFSGSGTTADAVMQINTEDDGNRKCISVQLAEKCYEDSEAYKAGYKTIADIAKERIRRAGKKIQEENPEFKGDLGFKVLKLSDSNFKQWQQITGKDKQALEEQMKLFVDPVAKNATTENMVYELLLKSGKDLNSTIESKEGFYAINETELVLILEKANQEIIDSVIASKPQKVIALDKLFQGNDQLKTNASLQMKDAGVEFKTI